MDFVVATLERLRFERGLPQRIYCDNGTEFVSAAMDLWAYTNGVILDFSRRGKPTDNAAIESFNGRFREECLNVVSQGPKPSGIRQDDASDGRGLTLPVNRKREAPHRSGTAAARAPAGSSPSIPPSIS